MARQARKVSPTKYYHVMMRGNNREKIFTRKDQKSYFIELLIDFKKQPPVEIAAYCVMDNHVHIVIAGEIDDLSEVMKRINIKYAMKFNKEADRIGHVSKTKYQILYSTAFPKISAREVFLHHPVPLDIFPGLPPEDVLLFRLPAVL